jgi:hypothetical protein
MGEDLERIGGQDASEGPVARVARLLAELDQTSESPSRAQPAQLALELMGGTVRCRSSGGGDCYLAPDLCGAVFGSGPPRRPGYGNQGAAVHRTGMAATGCERSRWAAAEPRAGHLQPDGHAARASFLGPCAAAADLDAHDSAEATIYCVDAPLMAVPDFLSCASG